MKRVLILGSSGRLGASLSLKLNFCDEFELHLHSRRKKNEVNADLTDRTSTFRMLETVKPDLIINSVALAEVEACEKNPSRAFSVNVLTIKHVAEWISTRSRSTYLVHISTDHVYDGVGVHEETDVEITNYYAFSKYTSELEATQVHSSILRVNFVGKSHSTIRQTFSDWIVSSLRQGRQIELVEDIRFSPTTVDQVISAVKFACQNRIVGTFNVGSWGSLTKSQFGFELASKLGLDQRLISPVKAEDCLSYLVYRPKNMVMDMSKWESETDLTALSSAEVISSVVSEFE